jgi:hypothetical protein
LSSVLALCLFYLIFSSHYIDQLEKIKEKRQRARTEDNGQYSDWKRLNKRDREPELRTMVNIVAGKD